MIKNTYHLYKPIPLQQKYPITDISRQIDVKWLYIIFEILWCTIIAGDTLEMCLN